MAETPGPIKLAWQSNAARRTMWVMAVTSFALIVCLGTLIRQAETQGQLQSVEEYVQTLSSTVLSSGTDSDDILLKVNDLLNVSSVLGVKLIAGNDIPLSVGETDSSFLNSKEGIFQFQWSSDHSFLDAALKLEATLPYDWLILRMDGTKLAPPPLLGSLINWVAAPLISFLTALMCLWAVGSKHLKPLRLLQDYLQENNGKYALSQVPQSLTDREDDCGLLARQIETMRQEVNDAKSKIEFQALFLHETPYPLVRCSVNRKVLYANVTARAENALFGDDSKEFVSPALSELVRKAFYESKEVFGDIRCRDHTIVFRAIPVLDAGYVNLYGEVKKRPDEII